MQGQAEMNREFITEVVDKVLQSNERNNALHDHTNLRNAALQREMIEENAKLQRDNNAQNAALQREIFEQNGALQRDISDRNGALQREMSERNAVLLREITEENAEFRRGILNQYSISEIARHRDIIAYKERMLNKVKEIHREASATPSQAVRDNDEQRMGFSVGGVGVMLGGVVLAVLAYYYTSILWLFGVRS